MIESPRKARRSGLARLVLLFPLLCTTGALGDETTTRWSETAYGISLDEPAGAERVDQPTTGETCVWVRPDQGWTISFDLTYTDQPVDLDDLTRQVIVDMGFATATPRVVNHAPPEALKDNTPKDEGKPDTDQVNGNHRRIGKRPGALMYFEIGGDSRPARLREWIDTRSTDKPWYYGQAIVMLEPYAAVVFKLNSDLQHADEARAAFETLLESLNVPLATELEVSRKAQVEAGDAWLKTVTGFDFRAAMPTEQFYRMARDGQDVGYIRMRTTSEPRELTANRLRPPGTLLSLDVRQFIAGQAVDTQSRIFASPEGERELWSSKTTFRTEAEAKANQPHARLPGAPKPRSAEPTWVETGVRDGKLLTVVIETPPSSDVVRQLEGSRQFASNRKKDDVAGSVDQASWESPSVAYLPRLWTEALADTLPRDEATYAFYAYDTQSGKLALRTVTVLPTPGGGHEVRDRPSPRSGEVVTRYDNQGRFVERTYPGGTVVTVATPEELKAVWDR